MPSIMITEVALLVCLETQRSARRRFELPTMKFSIQGLASTLAEIRDPKRRTRHNSSDVFRPLQARLLEALLSTKVQHGAELKEYV
jgi:hypothetical protein